MLSYLEFLKNKDLQAGLRSLVETPSKFIEDITRPESRQNIFDLVRGYAIREASPFISGSLTRDIEPFFMDDIEEERLDKKKLDEKKSLEKKQLFKKLYGR